MLHGKLQKRFASVLASFLCFWIIAAFGASPARAQWQKLATFDGYISCVRFVNDTLGFVGLGLSPGMPLPQPPIKVYRTTDGGLTWYPATVPQGYSGEIGDIQMVDTKNGWLAITGGRCALWKTTDGGVTWKETSLLGTGTSVRVTPSAIVVTNLGGFNYVSTDGGLTFQATSFGSTNGVDFVDGNHGAISGFRAPNWLYTADGGLTWQPSNLNTEGWSVYGAKGTSDFYAAPETNMHPNHDKIYKSSDYGATWNAIATFPFNFTGDIEGVGEDVLFFQVHWFDVGISQGFYFSTDKGITWTNIGGPNMIADTRFAVLNMCYQIAVYGYGDEGGKTLYRYIFPNIAQTAGTLTASSVSLPPISACAVADSFVPLSIGGGCVMNPMIDTIWLTGSPAFTLRNLPAPPISLTSHD
ncbi:MAG: WD40/YVTN/BNR-like repeat-containing protein, partial [Candidatus Kapaibacterium sp.]